MFQNEFESNYTELCKLGEGGSASVLKCQHKTTKLIKAAKVLRNDDPEYIAISRAEYDLVKSFDCPYIVKMYDCIHDPNRGELYLIMEFIEGVTIEDHV